MIKLQKEREESQKIFDEAEKSGFFSNLSKKQRQKIERGSWHVHSWNGLIKIAGFNDRFSDSLYNLLSTYAHSSFVSLMHLWQMDIGKKIDSTAGILNILYAISYKFIHELCNLHASIKDNLSEEDLVLIEAWHTITTKKSE